MCVYIQTFIKHCKFCQTIWLLCGWVFWHTDFKPVKIGQNSDLTLFQPFKCKPQTIHCSFDDNTKNNVVATYFNF